jgi:hypothetical protein
MVYVARWPGLLCFASASQLIPRSASYGRGKTFFRASWLTANSNSSLTRGLQ